MLIKNITFRKGAREISFCPYYTYLPNIYFFFSNYLASKANTVGKKNWGGGVKGATIRFLIKLINIFFTCFMHRWIPIYFLVFVFWQPENCLLFLSVLEPTIQFVSQPETTVNANATGQFLRKKTINILNTWVIIINVLSMFWN